MEEEEEAPIEQDGNIEHEEEVGDLGEERRFLFAPVRYLFLGEEEHHYVHPECVDFYSTPLVMILFIVAVLFLIFTSCMLVEQIEAITTNQGKIARMKMKVGQSGTEFNRVTDQFNEMFGGTSPYVAWHWFIPIPVQFPASYKKIVLGYEWDETCDPVPYPDPDSNDVSPTSSTTMTGEDGDSSVPNEAQDAALVEQPPRDLEEGLDEDGPMEEVTLRESSSRSQSPAVKKRNLARSVNSGSSTSLPTLT